MSVKNHVYNRIVAKVISRRAEGMAAVTAAALAALAVSSAYAGTSGAAINGGANAVTISLSGSTAMSNFTRSAGFSLLNPGSEITLNSGVGGAPVTYKAASGASTSVQLANPNFSGTVTANPLAADPAVTSGNYAGLRVEWHEQGSVEGIFELADSQINDGIYANTTYNGTSATGTFINTNKFGGTAATNAWNPPAVASVNGFTISTFANANDRTSHAQIQNRVQMGISDVNGAQGFSRAGSGAFNLAPGSAGYGKGNPALVAAGNVSGIGIANGRQQLLDADQLNMTTGTIDPGTIPGDVGSGGSNYAAGPWNNGNTGNLHNEKVAITATTFSANPGTGLTRLNRSDAQWLQAAGRLSNGADFNVTTRDVNSGTRNVAALNVGLDPSWAAGENDSGSGGGATQDGIGSGIKFSNKSSGGSNLRPTVQNARMAIGHLGLSDYRSGANNNNRPLRALDYRNALSDGGPAGVVTQTVGGKTFVVSRDGFNAVNAYNIVNGNYAVFQQQTYVTVKNPTQGGTAMTQFVADYTAAEGSAPTAQQQADLWSGKTINGGAGRTYVLNDNPTVKTVAGTATTYGAGIKGDNSGHDVYDVRQNILNSVNTFPPSSTASPADNLLNQSFILPQFMAVTKDVDGGATFANPSYNSTLSGIFLGGSSLANNFDVNGTTGAASGDIKGPADVTKGTGVTIYGNVTPAQGAINITDPGSVGGDGNWMFGNFKQNGIRDFAAIKAAADAQIALQTDGDGIDMFAGGSNSAAVTGISATLTAMQGHDGTAGAKKGDLIVMGDYDSDGDFDGRDLYLLARGAALADNTSTDQLTAASGAEFGDQVRRGVLRKNAALDHMAGLFAAGSPQALAAKSGSDVTGANAFNKRDVNRDGNVNLADAITSDKFVGKDYRNLGDQLAATGDIRLGDAPTPISLVDAELNDTGTINQADVDVVNTALTGIGSESWSGTTLKTGGGTVSAAYTGGTFSVASGAAVRIAGGTLSVGGVADPFTDNTGGATNGNHLAVENNAAFAVTAGGKAISTLTGAGNTTVSGGTLTTDYVRQAGLTVTGGSVAVRTNGNNASIVSSLSITAGGKLDLADNDLIVRGGTLGSATGGTYSGLSALVQSGANAGAWDGPGIITSRPDAAAGLTAIGVATGEQVKGVSGTATDVWNGQTVTGDDVLLMYTYAGDANLDGQITGDDYSAVDFNILVPGSEGWYNGDFNWDGQITGDDYSAIDFNILAQGAPLGSGGVFSASGVMAVPEPAGAGLMLMAAVGTSLAHRSAARRRRRACGEQCA